MPTIGWIDALRTYNAGMPSWCVPRKGTPGYERVMRIRQGEQTKGFKEVLEDLERKTAGKPKKEKKSMAIDLAEPSKEEAKVPTLAEGKDKTPKKVSKKKPKEETKEDRFYREMLRIAKLMHDNPEKVKVRKYTAYEGDERVELSVDDPIFVSTIREAGRGGIRMNRIDFRTQGTGYWRVQLLAKYAKDKTKAPMEMFADLIKLARDEGADVPDNVEMVA